MEIIKIYLYNPSQQLFPILGIYVTIVKRQWTDVKLSIAESNEGDWLESFEIVELRDQIHDQQKKNRGIEADRL
jgi:hypothetical protein